MKANTGQEPAFPAMDMNSHMGVDRMELRYVGLTKREYFAAMAMAAFIKEKELSTWDACRNSEGMLTDVAQACVAAADELLKALEQ